jgi:hypothetical protein
VSGFLFDALTGGHLGTTDDDDRPPAVLTEGLSNEPAVALDRVFPEEIAALLDELRARQRRLEDLPVAQRHIVLDLTTRQATHTACAMNLSEWHIDMAYPGYSRDFISFWARVPREALSDQTLYDSWRARAAARVSHRETGSRPSSRLRNAVERAVDELRRSPPIVDWEPWFRANGAWIREQSLECSDPEIRALCLAALESTLRTNTSGVILLLAMAMLVAPKFTAAS